MVSHYIRDYGVDGDITHTEELEEFGLVTVAAMIEGGYSSIQIYTWLEAECYIV